MAENNNTALWIMGGGVAAWLGYKYVLKPAVITPIQVKKYVGRINVQIPTLKLDGDNLVFDMYVQNVNNYPLTIRAIVADLYTEKYKIGNITRYGDVVIKPVNETKYTFKVRIKFIQALAYLNDLIRGKATTKFFLKGNINIDGNVYPVNMPIQP